MLVREAAAGGALEPAGQEGETGLPRGPWDTPAWGHGCGDKSWDTPPRSPHCGCHVTPDLSLGLGGGHLGSSGAAGRRRGTPAVPEVPRYGSWGDRGGVSPLGPPPPPPAWDVPQAPSPTPVTGSGVPLGCPCPASTPSPSPTVSASPGSVQEKSGVRRGLQGGERRQARATGHRDRLWRMGGGGGAGPFLQLWFLKTGRGECDLLPQNLKHLQFWLLQGVVPSSGGGTHPAQPPAGLSLCAHTHTDVALCVCVCVSPKTSTGDPFLGPGLRLPTEPLSEHGAAGGAARQRAGGHGAGTGGGGTTHGGTRDRALPDGEVPHFGGALGGGRGGAFVQVLQRPLQALAFVGARAAILSALHVVPGGPRGRGEMWHPDTGSHPPPPGVPRAGDVGREMLGMLCSTPSMEHP